MAREYELLEKWLAHVSEEDLQEALKALQADEDAVIEAFYNYMADKWRE